MRINIEKISLKESGFPATMCSDSNGLASPICHSAKSVIFESIFLHQICLDFAKVFNFWINNTMIEVYSICGIWHVFLYSIYTNNYHIQSMKYRQYA